VSKPATSQPARVSFAENRPLQVMTGVYALIWLALAISPLDRSDWLLENLLVFGFVGLLVATFQRFQFSNFSYFLFLLFLVLHSYGAHYTYAKTPFGFWLRDTFDLPRNPYDRIVHFAFGLLLVFPLRELAQNALHLRRYWSYLIPFLCLLGMSAGYEQIEAWVARIVSPELGAAYLGTQGDEWDAQKDMDRAMYGALLCLGLTWLGERARNQTRKRKARAA
jgi:putative membrane protein